MTGPLDRSRTVLIAPDSFKGSLTSVEVARALASGWMQGRPDDTVLLAPLADGGEGTIVAIEAAGGWTRMTTRATDPIGRFVDAAWLHSNDGSRAVVELAEASGLSRLANDGTSDERDPLRATTVGTGEVLRAVVDAGVRRITLGIGGSATNDGGAGILTALGARLVGATGNVVAAGGGGLADIDRIDLAGLDPRLADVDLRVACDVSNPLLGPTGAAATYGPQKGATPADIAILDAALELYATLLERASGRHDRDTPGAGAAGGTAFGLLSIRDRFRSVELVPGIDLVADETDLAGKLARADLVITGEGRIDAQTAFGKTAMGVARRAAERGRPCIAVGGGVEAAGIEALAPFGVIVVSVAERPMTVEAAMAAGAAPLERCGERLARLVSILA